MSTDHSRDETPEDDEHTRIVVRGPEEEPTRVVDRAALDERTRVAQRPPAAALPRSVDAADPSDAADVADASDAVDVADGETRIVPRVAGFPVPGHDRVPAPASPAPPNRFRPPSVASGTINSYPAHRVPSVSLPLNRRPVEPAPTVVLAASPAQIRAAGIARMRRRRWRMLALAVASTILVAAAAVVAIVALAGV